MSTTATPPPETEVVHFSLLRIAEVINKFLYAIVVAMGPEYESYKTLIVAIGWCVIVGFATTLIFFIVIKFASLFEETSKMVEHADNEEDSELNIPDIQYSHLEEITEHPPPEETPSKTLDELNQVIKEIHEKRSDENIVVALSSYNVRKSQIEKNLMDLRENSKKKIISYIKEEVDLFRDKIITALKQNIVKKNHISIIDVENNNDFIIFKLISLTARSKLIEHLILSYEKGDFDFHGEDQFDVKLSRKMQIFKHTYISVFQPMPIRVVLFSAQDVSDAVDVLNSDILLSLRSLVDLIAVEEIEVKKQTLALEEELNSAFSHIIQIIDNIQSKYGEIKA